MIDITKLAKGCMIDNNRNLKENLLQILEKYEPGFLSGKFSKKDISDLGELLSNLNNHVKGAYQDTGEVLIDVKTIFHNSREIWSYKGMKEQEYYE